MWQILNGTQILVNNVYVIQPLNQKTERFCFSKIWMFALSLECISTSYGEGECSLNLKLGSPMELERSPTWKYSHNQLKRDDKNWRGQVHSNCNTVIERVDSHMYLGHIQYCVWKHPHFLSHSLKKPLALLMRWMQWIFPKSIFNWRPQPNNWQPEVKRKVGLSDGIIVWGGTSCKKDIWTKQSWSGDHLTHK